jgi:hypothetical protein
MEIKNIKQKSRILIDKLPEIRPPAKIGTDYVQ